MNVDRPARGFRLPWQSRQAKQPADSEIFVSRHVPFIGVLPIAIKNHFVAIMAEFAGTFMFLLFAFGGTNVVNAAPKDDQPAELSANPAKILFISLCFGMSLAVNAWVFFRISGGLFNPAVSQRQIEYVSGSVYANDTTGVPRHDARRSCTLCPRLPSCCFTDPGRYCSCGCRICSHSWPSQRQDISWGRHIGGTRTSKPHPCSMVTTVLTHVVH